MIRHKRSMPIVAMLLGAAFVLTACGGGSKPIGVEDVRIPRPPTENMASLYLTLHNGTGTDDALVAVEITDAGSADLHRTEVTDDGLSTMTHVERIELPAGEDVVLEPGGLHVMIADPPGLELGDRIAVTLTFEHADPVSTEAVVVDPGDDEDAHHHDDHGDQHEDDAHD